MKAFLLAVFLLGLHAPALARTPQQDAELRDWIIGIQKLAQDAQVKADEAEKEAKASRDQAGIAHARLAEANDQIDAIQKAYDELQVERDKAIEHDKKTTKRNTILTNIVGGELAALALLLCLWLGVPRMAPPYGVLATCAAPVLGFGLIKFLL